MNSLWLKLLLVATFAFWATGAAKHIHEQTEHHGQDASIDEDDDDNGQPAPAVATATTGLDGSARLASLAAVDHAADKPHEHHVCPVCQMLAHMTVDSTVFPPPPLFSMTCVALVRVPDRQRPVLRGSLPLSARGPPALCLGAVAA